MRPKTLLILLVVVLGLGSFIWFYERKLPSSEKRAELEKRVLQEVEKDDVTAVTIEASKGTVRFERVEAAVKKDEKDGKDAQDAKDEEGGTEAEEEAAPVAEWRLVRPITARADAFAVDRLLDSILALEKTRTMDEVDPKAVGLDKPRATVRLATKDGERVLKLGAEVPTGGALIAGIEGGKEGYVVADAILFELDKDPGEWRDRTIFRGDRETVQRITMTGASGRVVLAKRPDGFWIESPIVDRADRNLLDGLFSDLAGLTAERFLDNPGKPPGELGLAPPAATVEVAAAGAPPLKIELGGPVGTEATPEGQMAGELTYARAGGPVFEVRTRLPESANRPPADWRALGLSAFEVHQIESVTVQDGAAPLALTRAEPDWKRGDVTVSYLPVSDLVFTLTDARADRLLAPAEITLGKPVVTVVLKTKDAGEETITLYPAAQGGVPARVGGRNVVLLLPADTLGQVRGKVAEVRNAKPVEEAGK
jgi:hypothetical protein